MTTATLHLSPRCRLCDLVGPAIVRWFAGRGLALTIRKDSAGEVPALPALVIGPVTLVGVDILGALRATERS